MPAIRQLWTPAGPTTTDTTTDWRQDAACLGKDPELFFPIGESEQYGPQTREAKAVCARCPVTEQCLQLALKQRETFGVWGGLSEKERRTFLRHGTRPKPTKREPAQCGTPSGYKRHVRNKSRICAPCRAANAAYETELNRRKQAADAA